MKRFFACALSNECSRKVFETALFFSLASFAFYVRLLIAFAGICHFNLGGYDRAQQAFLRVLQLRPGDADALCGLAAVEARLAIPEGLANCKVEVLRALWEKTLQYYEEAWKTNPHHCLVLLGMANSAFLAGKECKRSQDG